MSLYRYLLDLSKVPEPDKEKTLKFINNIAFIEASEIAGRIDLYQVLIRKDINIDTIPIPSGILRRLD